MRILLLLLSLFVYFGQETSLFPTKDYPVEVVIKGDPNIGNGPRSPMIVPVQAVVYESSIVLTFTDNLGNVEVSVEEAFGGLLLHTFVNSSTLGAVLPFSGGTGEYSITFTLPSGVVYNGSFVIE